MEKYYIYKFQNKIDGKIYIGQSINPEKRKYEHLYGRKKGTNTYFDKALGKYGLENFDFEVIDYTNNIKKIDELEKYYIKKYNCLKPNGYNILKGGRKQRGAWNSKEIDEYDLNGNYINSYESANYYHNFVNKEYNASSIRQCCNKLTHYKNRIFRFKGSDKPTPYIKPQPNHIRKIYQRDLEGNIINEFISVSEASRKTNSSRTGILGCANGYYKTAGGYIWTYTKEYENKNEFDIKSIIKTIIYQCDENKNIIKKYCNTREAEVDNGFNHNTYKKILKYLDTNKLYKNYYWYRIKFYEDNIVPSLNKD